MSGPLTNAGVFLIQFVFGLLSVVFLLRVMLQLVRANFFNPVCQFIVKVTNPILMPLSKVLPRIGRFDLAAAFVFWVLFCIELALVVWLRGGSIPPLTLLALSFVQAVDFTLVVILVILFIVILFSWITPAQNNPVIPLLYQLSEPILAPARRLLPPMGGFDLSPMLILLSIYLLRILLIQPLSQFVVGL